MSKDAMILPMLNTHESLPAAMSDKAVLITHATGLLVTLLPAFGGRYNEAVDHEFGRGEPGDLVMSHVPTEVFSAVRHAAVAAAQFLVREFNRAD